MHVIDSVLDSDSDYDESTEQLHDELTREEMARLKALEGATSKSAPPIKIIDDFKLLDDDLFSPSSRRSPPGKTHLQEAIILGQDVHLDRRARPCALDHQRRFASRPPSVARSCLIGCD